MKISKRTVTRRFLFILTMFIAVSGSAQESSELSLSVLSPTIIVAGPKATLSTIDPLGNKRFQKQYRQRREVAYAIGLDAMLYAMNPERDKESRTSDGELWADNSDGKPPRLDGPINSKLASYREDRLERLDVNYYAFDAKIFDEGSTIHPHGWGTLLVVGLGNNKRAGANLSQRCLIFDITEPERKPLLLSELKDSSMSACAAKPSALTLPNSFDGSPRWYLAFGSGKGAEQAFLYLYDLQTMKLSKKISVRQRGKARGGTSELYVGGISAADIDQDGITDLLYFGTVEEGKAKTYGSLYSLTFSKYLDLIETDRKEEDWTYREQYLKPPLAKIFQANGAIAHKPLLKRDSQGTVWLLFSTDSAIYAVKEDFSRQAFSTFQLGLNLVRKRGWYRTLPQGRRFTSGMTDLGEVIALNSFQRACDECAEQGINHLNLYHAFNGEEITELLADTRQTGTPSRGLLSGVGGFPRSTVAPLVLSPEFLSRLPIENKLTYGVEEKLHGLKIAEGIRRLSWWQQ